MAGGTNSRRIRRNNESGTLGAALAAGDTTITFTVAPGFATLQAAEYISLILEPDTPNLEIVWLTSYTAGATTGTILRAQEGTTAIFHASGVTWKHGPTTQDFGPQWFEPLIARASAVNVYDDEFLGINLDTAWTQVNRTGGAAITYTQGNGALSVYLPGGDVAAECHGFVKSLGALTPPVTIETHTRWFTPYAYQYLMAGPFFADGTTYGAGKQTWAMPYTHSGIATAVQLSVRTRTNYNTDVSTFISSNYQWMGLGLYQRLIWSAANTFQYQASADGISWISFGGNMSYTITPTHFGFGTSTWGGASPVIATYDYFRVS